MQATVHRFDAYSGDGDVLTDDGLLIPFDLDAFATSGLRHLRSGQRLTITLSDGADDLTDRRVVGMSLGSIPA